MKEDTKQFENSNLQPLPGHDILRVDSFTFEWMELETKERITMFIYVFKIEGILFDSVSNFTSRDYFLLNYAFVLLAVLALKVRYNNFNKHVISTLSDIHGMNKIVRMKIGETKCTNSLFLSSHKLNRNKRFESKKIRPFAVTLHYLNTAPSQNRARKSKSREAGQTLEYRKWIYSRLYSPEALLHFKHLRRWFYSDS